MRTGDERGEWLGSIAVGWEMPGGVIHHLLSPPDMEGRIIISRVDAPTCNVPDPYVDEACCGLISGHNGRHLACAAELVEQEGPFAFVQEPRD